MVILGVLTSWPRVEITVVMAHRNEDLGESEKGAVKTTPPDTDAVKVVNKEDLILHGGHANETSSGAAAQTYVLPGKAPDSEPTPEVSVESTDASGGEYSVFTVTQKMMIVLTASLASLFSPMATAIYCELPPP